MAEALPAASSGASSGASPGLGVSLLAPRSIALVGASADPRKVTARAQRYLRKHGYAGRLYPINPRRSEMFGEPAWRSIADLPEVVDQAYIMVGTDQVEAAVKDCAKAGIGCVGVLADGFAEAGPEGQARQDRLLAVAREHGVRLLGPNSMGVINLTDRIALCVNAVLDAAVPAAGPIGVLSQSGSLLGTLMSRGAARGLGFSKLVAVGNECDLSVGEIGELLVDDPATRVILLFLETIRQAERIEAMARRAHARGKPVIAYKLGRSEAGRELATSHTGALAGSDESVGAFLASCGILRVDLLETLFELPPLVMGRKPPEGRRVAVLTTTGGGGAMVVDRLGLAHVEVVAPPAEVIAGLAAKGITIPEGRLTDMTLAGTKPELVGPVLGAMLDSPHCDVVISVVGSSAMNHPELAVQPVVEYARHPKPLAAFLVPQANRSHALLAAAGVAGFRTPETCADAVRAFTDWRAPVDIRRPPIGDLAVAQRLLEDGAADEQTSLAVFDALGIPVARSVVIHDLENFSDAAAVVRFPAVAKILSPDIAHKTEVGGVILPIDDAAALMDACRSILTSVRKARPDARLEGILVQPLESEELGEALVGYRVDPQVGPMVVVGAGGVLAEVYRDVAVRRAPVDLEMAAEMVARIKGFAPLRGYRGMAAGDLDGLARAVAAMSDLARLPHDLVAEAEINPLLVRADGVIAVDGLIRRGPAKGKQP